LRARRGDSEEKNEEVEMLDEYDFSTARSTLTLRRI
jgi:hypothetical protein